MKETVLWWQRIKPLSSVIFQLIFNALSFYGWVIEAYCMNFTAEQKKDFLKALVQEMPFGKYQGHQLMDLPGHYLAWFSRQGFPDNKLGKQMALVFELDHNGLLGQIRQQIKSKTISS